MQGMVDNGRCTLGGREDASLKYTLPGKEVPLLVLGDPAYPLLSWLMKAFSDNGSLSCQQKTFNYRLSRARVVVEHAYGRLKGR